MIETAKKHILVPLAEAGYQALIAGGTVRDQLFHCDIHDVDIATNCPESTLAEIFPDSCFDISKNMNLKVFLVRANGYKYEIAHFRGSGKDSRHRPPHSAESEDDPEQDALRRDFTINALFMDLSGNIIDYVGGQKDIQDTILRCVGDCHARFDEDVLRILRGIRLAAKFDLSIEENTGRAMREHAARLLTLPSERVLDELNKMMTLGGKKFSRALKMMSDTNVLRVILPEIASLQGFKHDPEFHPEGDALAHVIAALESCESVDPDLLWAVLLHDVGKAVTYQLREKCGKMRHTYYEHEISGVPIIESLAARLGLPNRTRDIATFCAAKHLLCHRIQEMKPGKILLLVEHPYFQYLMEVADCDVQCRNDGTVTEEIVRRKNFIKKFRETTKTYTSVVNGKFVMDICNIPEGPKVGILIAKLKEYIADNAVSDPENIKCKLLALNKSI